MARAFLSFSLLLRSMSSISLIFCKGSPGRLLSWQDTMVGACHLRGQPWCLLAGAPPIDSTLAHFLGFPTWEISARMIPRYCLPCPRASMAAKNSFLSWTSFTTAQRGRAISAQGSGSARGHRQHMASEGERGRGGGGKVYSKSCSLVSPISSTHTLTFFKPVQLGSWLLLLHTGNRFTFLYVLSSGKDILESSFLLLQISCRAQRRSC